MKERFQQAIHFTNVHIMSKIEMNHTLRFDREFFNKDVQSMIFVQNNQIMVPSLSQTECSNYNINQFKRVQSDVCTKPDQRFQFQPISLVLGNKRLDGTIQQKIAVPSIVLNHRTLRRLNDSIQSNLQQLTKNNSKCVISPYRHQSIYSKKTSFTICTPTWKKINSFQSHKAKNCVLGESIKKPY